MRIPVLSLAACLYIFILLQACSPGVREYPDKEPRKIEVLFLGHDSEHHNSEKYMPVLASALARNGINFTYTDTLEALNQENLQKYDALMLYANHDSISKDQETALLSYVGEGHGFLPIHCASWCFRNSQAVVELMGGQFKSHETGVFQASIIPIVEDHPVLQGFEPFESWDETYVHSHHNPDRTVLMERIEGDHHEPWTWVRNYKKGRVFYTASGHDERTWEEPQFHKLLKNAIVWAVGDRVKGLWEQLPEFPDPKYSEAIIPNYEKRDPPPRLQEPLSAEASQLLTQIPPRFELTLFAQEPDIINPISMDWDEKGRLWVIETVDYPNTVRDEDGVGDDRIKILEDTDGDGRADKVTVFADNLNIPTSLVFSNGGIIVSQAPHFLFLKDTDGDDVADVRTELITGWGTFDTHAGPSNLFYAHDNRIWGAVGYSGFNGTVDGETFKFGQGLYAFDPDGTDFEYITRTSNNTWGLGFTEDFQVFGSTANNTHSVYVGIPNRYYEGVQGLPGYGSAKIDGHYAFHPITQNVRQVDVFNGFTAAAGHHFYTARQFPQKYWNKIAFVCAPTGRLVHEAVIQPDGATYAESDGWNVMASNDEWFGPVEARVGPDGSLWIADWYNFIIQHNPTPPGFENGKGNAHINPLRDRKHGRIYRLTYKYGPEYTPMQLSKDDPKGLIAALSHDNMHWRLTAQRLLVEKGNDELVSDLLALIKRGSKDKLGLKPSSLHALWTLKGLGLINAAHPDVLAKVIDALSDPVPSIRRAAIQVLPRIAEVNEAIVSNNLLDDTNPQVQLSAILATTEMPPSEELGSKLYELSKDEVIEDDIWLSQAIYCAAARHRQGFLNAWSEDSQGEKFDADQMSKDWVNRTDYANWDKVDLPAWFADMDHEHWDGSMWYKKEVMLGSDQIGQTAIFSMGFTDDADTVYINGQMIGNTSRDYSNTRKYRVPSGLLKEGKNIITIQIADGWGRGGMGGEAADIHLRVSGQKIPLDKGWFYAEGKERFNGGSKMFGPDKSILKLLVASYQEDGQLSTSDQSSVDIVLELGVVPNELKYDKTELEVKAGQMVEIRFSNKDFMQHNLLIISPGSLEKVGASADKLAAAPNGAEQQYIPEMSEVLFHTSLVDPNSETILRFRAPDSPGDYPFVCTFPGHWKIMNGVLHVKRNNAL